MKVVWSPKARRRHDAQINYLIDQHAPQAAQRLKDRIAEYISNTLANFPGTGDHIEQHDFYEVWIPKTKIVLWYRFNSDTLIIIDLWHTSRQR